MKKQHRMARTLEGGAATPASILHPHGSLLPFMNRIAKILRPIVARSIRFIIGHAFTRGVRCLFRLISFDLYLCQCREPLRAVHRAIMACLLHWNADPRRRSLLPVSNMLSISVIFGTKEGCSAFGRFPSGILRPRRRGPLSELEDQ